MNTLQPIADYIKEHGWIQGTLWDNLGRVCLSGAVISYMYDKFGTGYGYKHAGDEASKLEWQLYKQIELLISAAYGPYVTKFEFNDHIAKSAQ